MTDGTGQIVNEYSYGPHGERLGIVEGTHNPFGYVGRRGVMEEGSGLKFMRGRYYDDGTGRFLNKDLVPGNIRKPQSLNRYAYVSNNPINLVDPGDYRNRNRNRNRRFIRVTPPTGQLAIQVTSN